MSTFSTSSRQKRLKTLSFLHFWLRNVLRATTACTFFDTFSTSEPPKAVRDRQFLTLLTWKCASRHNGVHFFDISTSKSGPDLVCFVHFDLEMCFAPQRRALFRHCNFQKSSDAEVFCTFWLGNVLRATTACAFSTSQLPKVVRCWGVLYLLTWKYASRHNGVQFFIAHLASWLRTRRFSEPTFRPSGATNHWKNTVFRDFPTFSRICIFFLPDSFSSDLLSSNLPLLSASALLCFSSVHIVGSLTSKLPSNSLRSESSLVCASPRMPWMILYIDCQRKTLDNYLGNNLAAIIHDLIHDSAGTEPAAPDMLPAKQMPRVSTWVLRCQPLHDWRCCQPQGQLVGWTCSSCTCHRSLAVNRVLTHVQCANVPQKHAVSKLPRALLPTSPLLKISIRRRKKWSKSSHRPQRQRQESYTSREH